MNPFGGDRQVLVGSGQIDPEILASPAEEGSILRFAELAPRLYRSFEEHALEELR